MSPRERFLAMIVLGIVVVAGLVFMAFEFYIEPLRQRDASIAGLQTEIMEKEIRVSKILKNRTKLARWRQLSLPADVNLAQREYVNYLGDQLRRSGFTADTITGITPKQPNRRASPKLPGKKEPIYTVLSYDVNVRGELDKLVSFLDRFYHTGLMHRIKNLAVRRPLTSSREQTGKVLDISLTIEALIVHGGLKRDQLLGIDNRLLLVESAAVLQGGPSGLGFVLAAAGPRGPAGPRVLAEPPRQYDRLVAKNIFYGPPPPPPPPTKKEPPPPKPKVDTLRHIYLTDITEVDNLTEAVLYDRYQQRQTRLSARNDSGRFRILNGDGKTVLEGKVLRIEGRDILFQVGEKYHAIHIGDNLKNAMKATLTKEQQKTLFPVE